MEKKPRRTWGDGLKVPQGSRDRAPQASWVGARGIEFRGRGGGWELASFRPRRRDSERRHIQDARAFAHGVRGP